MHLAGYESRPATNLSGGQQQRLALARALIREPKVLLFDEPLSNLDAKLRERMRGEIRDLQRRLGITTVYVTHDQAEALSMSDRIAVLADGRIVQEGRPREIYHAPATTFVADFVGTSNALEATVVGAGSSGRILLETPIGRLEASVHPKCAAVRWSRWRCDPKTSHPSSAPVRPNVVAATVGRIVFLGEVVQCELEIAGILIASRQHPATELRRGDIVHVELPADRCTIFVEGPAGDGPDARTDVRALDENAIAVIDRHLSAKFAIAGIGETAVGKLPEHSTTGLALAAMRAAIQDAGLTAADVDGVVCDQPNNAPHRAYALALARNIGIAPGYATDIALGGASPIGCVAHAIMAISAGLCSTVVCVHTQKQATGRGEAHHGPLFDGLEDYEEPFGLTSAVSQHATVAARHMHDFGTTSEQLAAVAVAFRKHAALNPAATMRKPITVADVLASRWVTKPFHLLDCCLVSDGAGAVVVTRANAHAPCASRRSTWRVRPRYTAGPFEMPTLTTLGSAQSSTVAYAMSGLRPADVDFAELYDCFTIIPLVTLEDYGFCKKGEGGAFVRTARSSSAARCRSTRTAACSRRDTSKGCSTSPRR